MGVGGGDGGVLERVEIAPARAITAAGAPGVGAEDQHDGGLGSGNVTVNDGATLKLNLGATTHNYIGDSAAVSINGSGKINLLNSADNDRGRRPLYWWRAPVCGDLQRRQLRNKHC